MTSAMIPYLHDLLSGHLHRQLWQALRFLGKRQADLHALILTERTQRMEATTATHEALTTLNQKLTEAHDRSAAQEANFGVFVKNVMQRLDKNDISETDLNEIKQMMTTADSIGLSGLADFGVTPDGQAVPTIPAPAPVTTPRAPIAVTDTPPAAGAFGIAVTPDASATPAASSVAVPADAAPAPVVTTDGAAVQTASGEAVVATPAEPAPVAPAPSQAAPDAQVAPAPSAN